MKVFVLVSDMSIDYENYISCIGVYETFEQAVYAMFSNKKLALKTIEFPNQQIDYSNDIISIYEDGDYTRNHIDWEIFEKEIIYNSEQLN